MDIFRPGMTTTTSKDRLVHLRRATSNKPTRVFVLLFGAQIILAQLVCATTGEDSLDRLRSQINLAQQKLAEVQEILNGLKLQLGQSLPSNDDKLQVRIFAAAPPTPAESIPIKLLESPAKTSHELERLAERIASPNVDDRIVQTVASAASSASTLSALSTSAASAVSTPPAVSAPPPASSAPTTNLPLSQVHREQPGVARQPEITPSLTSAPTGDQTARTASESLTNLASSTAASSLSSTSSASASAVASSLASAPGVPSVSSPAGSTSDAQNYGQDLSGLFDEHRDAHHDGHHDDADLLPDPARHVDHAAGVAQNLDGHQESPGKKRKRADFSEPHESWVLRATSNTDHLAESLPENRIVQANENTRPLSTLATAASEASPTTYNLQPVDGIHHPDSTSHFDHSTLSDIDNAMFDHYAQSPFKQKAREGPPVGTDKPSSGGWRNVMKNPVGFVSQGLHLKHDKPEPRVWKDEWAFMNEWDERPKVRAPPQHQRTEQVASDQQATSTLAKASEQAKSFLANLRHPFDQNRQHDGNHHQSLLARRRPAPGAPAGNGFIKQVQQTLDNKQHQFKNQVKNVVAKFGGQDTPFQFNAQPVAAEEERKHLTKLRRVASKFNPLNRARKRQAPRQSEDPNKRPGWKERASGGFHEMLDRVKQNELVFGTINKVKTHALPPLKSGLNHGMEAVNLVQDGAHTAFERLRQVPKRLGGRQKAEGNDGDDHDFEDSERDEDDDHDDDFEDDDQRDVKRRPGGGPTVTLPYQRALPDMVGKYANIPPVTPGTPTSAPGNPSRPVQVSQVQRHEHHHSDRSIPNGRLTEQAATFESQASSHDGRSFHRSMSRSSSSSSASSSHAWSSSST